MGKTYNTKTTTKYGYRRLPKLFGKGTKMKYGRLAKQKDVNKTKVPKKITSEQIVAGMKGDKAKLQGLKAIEKAKDIRTSVLSTSTNAAQAIGGATAAEFNRAQYNSARGSSDLSQLVSGGITNTGTSRDDDEDQTPEVN